ncbi:sulfonate transport system substrate-binding protein [Nocardioides zeae]|uniref:Sulfonate transport system substrate-binding protein n=1 Tax=Nocardioides zeae TaxID=1457234 RepID=A0ACC6IEV2_9ACTN|nr:NrtA/SsuA/CpmA family ABC transporter substrate-binding protein [Nocardioides zeae]MDR6174894.1 sulfonate transport system substrate-binding protein [Nocardioides zeae]MDR6209296.1 sulfonate transport system substrate-binding protein [Nocardioides zeae]
MKLVPARTLAVTLASALALGGCAAGGSDGDGDGDAVTFRAAYLPTANYLTTVKDSGLLEEHAAAVGADVEWIGPLDPFVAYDTVTAGEADASSTGTGYFVNLAANGDQWVAFALEKYDGTSQGIVAGPDTGITSVADLVGKKIGIDGPGATGDYLVNLAFEQAGLDVDDVEKVTLDTTTFATAFASGQVDAIASYDQNLAAALAVPGAVSVVRGADLPSYNWSIHIVSRDFAENHPEELKAIYDGLVEEAARAADDPSVITDAYTAFGATDEVVEQIADFDVPTIEPLDDAALADLQALADQYVEFGFLDEAPDLSDSVIDLS